MLDPNQISVAPVLFTQKLSSTGSRGGACIQLWSAMFREEDKHDSDTC